LRVVNRNRVKKTEGGQTILYVNRYYEKNLTTGNVTTSYYLGGRLIAQREGSVLRYAHQDHLAGTSIMTDNSGALISSIKYLPFGQTRSGSVPTDIKFTGQRLDATDLYYYGARYYDPAIGRFISPDPFVQLANGLNEVSYSLSVNIIPSGLGSIGAPQGTYPKIVFSVPVNPQSLNRYSYVLDNPLRYIDPTGYMNWGSFWVGVALVGVVAAAVFIIVLTAPTIIPAIGAVMVGFETIQIAADLGLLAVPLLLTLSVGIVTIWKSIASNEGTIDSAPSGTGYGYGYGYDYGYDECW